MKYQRQRLRDHSLKLSYPGHRTQLAARLLHSLFLIVLTCLALFPIPTVHPNNESSQTPTSGSALPTTSTLGTSLGLRDFGSLGADPVPNLSLPKIAHSKLYQDPGSGLIKTSADNLTLYTSTLAMRLLGGLAPHDQLLGPGFHSVSHYSFWTVEAYDGALWSPLLPSSNNLTIVASNATGTYVTRTMRVDNMVSHGFLRIVYKALSTGPLKWDLDYTPYTASHYRLVYHWLNTSSVAGFLGSAQYRVSYGFANYTFSWNDVQSNLTPTPVILPGQFHLSVDLGILQANATIHVDPQITSTLVNEATGYSFQRHVFYEPKGGYYWAFFVQSISSDLAYSYSSNGNTWSTPAPVPAFSGNFVNTESYLPDILNVGQYVVVADGTAVYTNYGNLPVYFYYVRGTISGSTITWDNPRNVAFTIGCGNCQRSGIRFSKAGLTSDYYPVYSFNVYSNYNNGCTTSSLYYYRPGVGFPVVASAGPQCSGSNYTDQYRSILIPADSMGTMRVIYQDSIGNGYGGLILKSRTVDASNNLGAVETIDQSGVVNSDEFSAVADTKYGTHLLYRSTVNGNVTYAYHVAGGAGWTNFQSNIFSAPGGLPTTSPTLTIDLSTNDLYAFGFPSGFGAPFYPPIAMKVKTPSGRWTDSSVVFPVWYTQIYPRYLSSNYASVSNAGTNTIQLLWTEGNPTPYTVSFASIPINTVWSPYTSPADPWDGNGVSPYGQYFSNLGESVSPSNGMLTVRQTDMSLNGRRLNLDLARIYVQPSTFLNGPYNYENYPWVPMGNGWRLDLPWLSNVTSPSYIHLNGGEGYRIPGTFWANLSSTFENHQGDDFLMTHIQATQFVYLVTRSGVYYQFDPSRRLTDIYVGVPPGGSDSLHISYDARNRIAGITDDAGRVFVFNYNAAGLLSTMWERSPVGLYSIRTITFGYNRQTLTAVTDPAGRVTSYQYNTGFDSTVSPWLLSRITYPTGWYSNYTFAPSTVGTQAASYRVTKQFVGYGSGSGTRVREFDYGYSNSGLGVITNSTVTMRDATQVVGYTTYSFSFQGVVWNISDAFHHVVRGYMQQYGVHGLVEKETVLVRDRPGGSTGSYSNYYKYDLWGNMIYSRRAIRASGQSSWNHETFNSYYNDGLPLGFFGFADTFSQNQGTTPDNSWTVNNGSWIVNAGSYNATSANTQAQSVFAWSDIGKTDISITGQVNISGITNSSAGRVGLFAHYPGTGNSKWALVLRTSGVVALLDDSTNSVVASQCSLDVNGLRGLWASFNLTLHRNLAWGNVTFSNGIQCIVTGMFPSGSMSTATGFGIYAGGINALFRNLIVATSPSSITTASFSNSFVQNGGPGQYSNIHSAIAGSAEFQNVTTSPNLVPLEVYYTYYSWGGLSQTRQLYSSPGQSWLVSSRTYDSYGNIQTITDPLGNTAYYTYSARYASTYLTNQTRILNPGGTRVSSLFSYDFGMGTLLSSVDPKGYNTTLQYDILNRRTLTSYPNNDFELNIYNDTLNYVDTSNENGWKVRQAFDGLGRLFVAEKFLNGIAFSNETYSYNWRDQKTTAIDPLNKIYNYQYDVLGRITQTVKPDGNSTQLIYSDLASTIQSFNEAGYSKAYMYDRLGRLVQVGEYIYQCSLVCITFYNYDEVGNLRQVQTSNSQITSYAYDSLNRLTSTNYPDQTSEGYFYDNDGNVIGKNDRSGGSTATVYDSLNRLLQVTRSPRTGATATENYAYDANSNLVRLQSTNATIEYSYDVRNRVTSETYKVNADFTLSVSPSSVSFFCSITRCSPTSASATLTITSINGFSGTILLSYNPPNPSGGTLVTGPSSAYLPAGGTVQATIISYLGTRSGTYRWSILGQVGSIVASTTYTIQEYVCTSPPCPTGPGGLPPTGPLGPSSSKARATYTVGYAYAGEVLSAIQYPDGLTIQYQYDRLGRLVTVSDATPTTYATLSYFLDGKLKGIAYASGLVANYTYDGQSRTKSISLLRPGDSTPTLLSLNYQYNNTGTVARVYGLVNGTNVSEQYRYDELSRLVNSTVTSGGTTSSTSYQYDNVANRLRQTLNNQVTSYTYNQTNNELSSSVGPNGNLAYQYDALGNLKSKTVGTTTSTYNWDPAGNLINVANNGVLQAIYAYDGQGRRVESSETNTVFYAYFGTETLFENTTGVGTTDYVYAGGARLAKISSGAVYYYHTDVLGSTRLVTDRSRSVMFSNSYQPFGQDNGSPNAAETYRFTGKPYSTATGFYYYYQRWYDPSIGRFISSDPVAGRRSNPQTLNGYIYVIDNPLSGVDPSGLSCTDNISSFFGCAGGFLYDNTVGAAVNSYNWYQSASDSDRAAFWMGVGTAAAVGFVVGASCVVAACAGLLLVGVGLGTAIGGSYLAGGIYRAAGGTSEGGLKATMFWGGIGAGAGFGVGGWAAASSWNSQLAKTVVPNLTGTSSVSPGIVSRLGSLGGSYYSSEAFADVGSLEAEFGGVSRSLSEPLYRITAQIEPGVSYQFGRGATGVMQYYVSGGVNGSAELYSPAFRSIAIAANIVGGLFPRIPF